jgi:hypothetical protein
LRLKHDIGPLPAPFLLPAIGEAQTSSLPGVAARRGDVHTPGATPDVSLSGSGCLQMIA